MSALSPELKRAVLDYLEVEAGTPTIAFVDNLLTAYTGKVPWESAFRIARRGQITNITDCPRWPEIFWTEAIQKGGGGTCFESNYAFFSLLQALGYEGYLTINNMGDSIGCHTAIVLNINSQCWLVDVGLPIYVALPIDADAVSRRESPFLSYAVIPDGVHRYQIERHPHPNTNCFTLIDQPVSDAVYRLATTNDYGLDGLFLDKVIVNKVINGLLWRFNSVEKPYHLESFRDGQRTDNPITGDMAETVARHFGMEVETVKAALQSLE